MFPPFHSHRKAFTLAELLIALAILGIVATFTIPKVLTAQQSAKEKAIAKEAIAAITNAYQLYGLNNLVSASTTPKDFTPYLNYVKYDTTSTNAYDYPFASVGDCDVASPCIYLHNGAVIQLYSNTFGGTANTNMVWFLIDPDGSKTGSPNGGGLEVALYYNGRIATWQTLESGSVSSWGPYNPNAFGDPPWFSWN